MRVFLICLLFTSFVIAAEKPVAQVSEKPTVRYRHIEGPDGKILLTVDLKDKSIEYHEDPKKVVELLLDYVSNVTNQCQAKIAQLTELQKPVAKKK